MGRDALYRSGCSEMEYAAAWPLSINLFPSQNPLLHLNHKVGKKDGA
jgi:hypothetical protein